MEPDDLSLAAAREVMGWAVVDRSLPIDEHPRGSYLIAGSARYRAQVVRSVGDFEVWCPDRDIAQALEVATKATGATGHSFHLTLAPDGVDLNLYYCGIPFGGSEDCAPEDRLKVAARLITSAAVRMVRAAREKEETP